MKTAFRKLRRDAELDEKVVPYTIRHTNLRRGGVDPWEVAGMLGHKVREFRTTERYARFDPSYLSGAITAIDEYFEELQPLVKIRLIRGSSDPIPDRRSGSLTYQ